MPLWHKSRPKTFKAILRIASTTPFSLLGLKVLKDIKDLISTPASAYRGADARLAKGEDAQFTRGK